LAGEPEPDADLRLSKFLLVVQAGDLHKKAFMIGGRHRKL
jgi:hypothetical protein